MMQKHPKVANDKKPLQILKDLLINSRYFPIIRIIVRYSLRILREFTRSHNPLVKMSILKYGRYYSYDYILIEWENYLCFKILRF